MPKPVKKNSLFPIAYDEVSLVDDGAAGSAHVLIKKRRVSVAHDTKPSGKKESPCKACGAKENSTGKKDGKSTRSKNWKSERHPRDEEGKMAPTSSESKAAHGKGGTTQAKLDSQCKKCKGKKESRKIKNPNVAKTNQPTAMSRWDSDAHIRAIMERK